MLINLLQDEDQATDAPATDGDTDGDTATPEAPAEGGDSEEKPAEGGGDETPAA